MCHLHMYQAHTHTHTHKYIYIYMCLSQASLGLEIHDAKTFFDMLIGVSDVTWLHLAPRDDGKSPEIV